MIFTSNSKVNSQIRTFNDKFLTFVVGIGTAITFPKHYKQVELSSLSEYEDIIYLV